MNIQEKIANAKRLSQIKGKSIMNILSIDQASNCGWCCGDNLYGVWDFNTRKDESSGMKMLRFKAKLIEVCKLSNIQLIVYERVAGFHKNSIIHAAKMVSIIETFCEEAHIEYRAYSAKEIKKFATGNGNASKQMMIEAAKEKFGYDGNNDNEADAISMYHLVKQEYNI